MTIYNAAWAIPLLPLLGAALSFGLETQRRAAQLCVVFSGLSFVVAAVVLVVRMTHATGAAFNGLLTFFTMTPPEGAVFATQFQAQVGVHVDALSASFAAAIAFATVLIQAYALAAMRGEPGFRRFFWASSVLGFSTTGFVLSPNLFNSLFMWVVATASLYLLMPSAWQRVESAPHILRGMVVLTAGDVALTLGVVFTWIKFGVFSSLLAAPAGQTVADPLSFEVVGGGVTATLHHAVASTGPRAILVMGIVFVVAAVARGVQFPFHLWLIDCANSAIPVVALAAATVAPLGVFLLARVYPVLAYSPRVLPVLALVGGVSATLTALTGAAQRSIRRIAVCAIASELGFAFVALGMGGYSTGIFIAFSSVFTSTLVLMAAGNLARAYRTDDITEMGGAWTKLRTTSVALGAWALLAGGLSLTSYLALSSAFSGIDPPGGVFSKVERSVVTAVTVVAAAAVTLLAARLLVTVTSGAIARRRGFQHERMADVEPGLRRPLWLALLGAVVAVLVALPFHRFVVYGRTHQQTDFEAVAALVALLILAGGVIAAVFLYTPARRVAAGAAWLPAWLSRLLEQGFYADRVSTAAGLGLSAVASRVASFDEVVTAPLAASVGESVELAARGVGSFRNARLGRYLAGALAVLAVLALLSVLAATGHLWVHTV